MVSLVTVVKWEYFAGERAEFCDHLYLLYEREVKVGDGLQVFGLDEWWPS